MENKVLDNGEIVYIFMKNHREPVTFGVIEECLFHSDVEADVYRVIGDDGRKYEVVYPNDGEKVFFMLTRVEYLELLMGEGTNNKNR